MKYFQRLFVCFFLFSVLVCSAFAQPVVKVSVLRPLDQPVVYRHETDAIREEIIEIQSFFASEMNRLGYGKKTFKFETNIPIYIGARELSFYQGAEDVRWQQGATLKKYPNDIHLVFVDGKGSFKQGTGDAAGVFTHRCDATGNCDFRRLIAMPLEGNAEYRNRITAHELAHAFGFYEHLNTGKNYVMEAPLPIIPGEGHLLNFQLHLDVAKTLNQSNDLSVNNDVDTSKFDRIVRRSDNLEEDDSEKEDDSTSFDADVNKDGYVDLSDVMIVRSGMQNSTSYDTDLNDDGITDEVDLAIVKLAALDAIAAAAPRKRKVKFITWGSLKRY